MRGLSVCLALVLCLLWTLFTRGDVIHLTPESFEQHVDGSSNILVEFYAPWCGHCKALAPEWEVAGKTFQAEDDIKLAALDATTAQADRRTKADKHGASAEEDEGKGEAEGPDAQAC